MNRWKSFYIQFGSSTIEVLVALFLFSFLFLALGFSMLQSMRSFQKSEQSFSTLIEEINTFESLYFEFMDA